MQGIVSRVVIVALLAVVLWIVVWWVRRRIDRERRLALAAATVLPGVGLLPGAAPVRILAFSSQTCRPCHTLQRPALEQIAAIHGSRVEISWIDAPSSPELAQHYHVLTVPTTVVLDARSRVHAVNYGFANTQRLLEQINSVLQEPAEEPA